MKINIYQINRDRDTQRLKFLGLDAARQTLRSAELDCATYDKVYSGDVKCRNLEDVFVLFNSGRPEGFRGHSLSVSDVVEVEDAASITPGFFPLLIETHESSTESMKKLRIEYNGQCKKMQNEYKSS